MDFGNATSLNSNLLLETFRSSVTPWPTSRLTVRVRWSRGADFSGTCMYESGRVYVNLGRHLRYPYHMQTYCARSRQAFGRYYKPATALELADGYQVCLFVFLHEIYHWLVKQAGRNTARKESMCDRFAARTMIDDYGCKLRDRNGQSVPRGEWDIQDLDEFVAAARPTGAPAPRPARAARGVRPPTEGPQFLLFK